MLSKELMGALALAILWVNTLLVAAAALKELASIRRRLRTLRPLDPAAGAGAEGLLEGRVEGGEGRAGAIAGQRVDQVGRAGAEERGRETILFSDTGYSGEVYGGEVEAGGRVVAVAPVLDAEVWVPAADLREAFACPSAARFDEAYPHARKARGYSRTLEAPIRTGAAVWLFGALQADARGGVEIAPALIASVDPRAWCRSKMALLAAFAAGVLGIAAGCTAVALMPPAFGRVSMIGAAMSLAFFLLVQPAGTAVRDAVRAPNRAIVRGKWVAPREG